MNAQTIRQKAEALLKETYPEQQLPSDDDLPKILHELRVHQVELELQNDELRRIQAELQVTQRKYFDLFNLAPVSYFLFSRQGQIVELNLTATQLLQRGRKYLVGKPLLPHLAPESRQLFFEHLDSVFSTQMRQQCELKIQHPEHGEQTGIFVRVDSVAVYEGDAHLCRSTMTDISQQRALEAEMLKTQKLEAVGLLAGGIAHDFNNLLTGLFGNVELAQLFLAPEHKSYKYLASAIRSIESATNLTTQLLTFAKGGDPIREIVSIGEVTAETAHFSLRGSTVRLEIKMAPDLWLIDADKGQLSQVISNLVINAQQAMPTGGVITITADNVTLPDGRFVRISIQDEGGGIPPKYLPKVFDPYFSTKQRGSGLGLAITHSIIRKHNGRITVDSQLNQGTCFTIHLPAIDAPPAAQVTPPTADRAVPHAAPARILVLDDEEAVRDVAGAMLELMGHHVTFAVDGREAVEQYQAARQNGAPFHAVILDLTIPGGMGGQKATAEILAFDPNARLVVSSGYATDPILANYQAHGFKGRAVKPYRFEELRDVIQGVLDAAA
ncbi:MAG: response regulator [Anaerolineales bacterium]|nr:response regulator [Anaerolineales bacterium]